MKEHALPTYKQLNSVLRNTTLKLNPSQVHGLICGVLCGQTDPMGSWEDLVTGGKKNSTKTHNILQSLFQSSTKQLEEFLFEFELVLPTDSEELPMRAEALTLWCQGYLTGLKITNIPLEERENNEITEAINDLIEISKMNYEEVVENEEDEEAYMELVEYVRMAVILIYQDLKEEKNSKEKKNSSNYLH